MTADPRRGSVGAAPRPSPPRRAPTVRRSPAPPAKGRRLARLGSVEDRDEIRTGVGAGTGQQRRLRLAAGGGRVAGVGQPGRPLPRGAGAGGWIASILRSSGAWKAASSHSSERARARACRPVARSGRGRRAGGAERPPGRRGARPFGGRPPPPLAAAPGRAPQGGRRRGRGGPWRRGAPGPRPTRTVRKSASAGRRSQRRSVLSTMAQSAGGPGWRCSATASWVAARVVGLGRDLLEVGQVAGPVAAPGPAGGAALDQAEPQSRQHRGGGGADDQGDQPHGPRPRHREQERDRPAAPEQRHQVLQPTSGGRDARPDRRQGRDRQLGRGHRWRMRPHRPVHQEPMGPAKAGNLGRLGAGPCRRRVRWGRHERHATAPSQPPGRHKAKLWTTSGGDPPLGQHDRLEVVGLALEPDALVEGRPPGC